MAVTPICEQFSRLTMSPKRHGGSTKQRVSHSSLDIFASALRPLRMDLAQRDFIRVRAVPARNSREIERLRVRPFRLAPKCPPTGPVDFKDIVKSVDNAASSEDAGRQSRIMMVIKDPRFLKALAAHHVKKVMRLRRHLKVLKPRVRTPLPLSTLFDNHKPSGFRVPRPSTPFNFDKDLDPFMLFPEWQWPASALKADSRQYVEEAAEAREAQEGRLRARRGSMTVEEIKDMIHMSLVLGKYASPSTPQTVSCYGWSPMEVDG